MVIIFGVPSSLSLTFKSGTTTCVSPPGFNSFALVVSFASGFLLIPKSLFIESVVPTVVSRIPSGVPSVPTPLLFGCSPSALFQLVGRLGVVAFNLSLNTTLYVVFAVTPSAPVNS